MRLRAHTARTACLVLSALDACMLAPRADGMQAQGSPGRGTPPRAPTSALWFRQPAAQWEHALPVGNGRLGAMVFGGAAEEHLQLNDETLWSGGPYNPVVKGAHAALPEIRRLLFAGDVPPRTTCSGAP